MENKINIAELLKDCPKGMELYSPIFGKVYLEKIRPHLAIIVSTGKEQSSIKEEFLYDGRYGMNGECMLFPSKEKTTWEGFEPSCKFKDGDVLFMEGYKNHQYVFIFNKPKHYGDWRTYCYLNLEIGKLHPIKVHLAGRDMAGREYKPRFATEEEKQKLFDAIKANGYKWNAKKKCLEKLPKFKVGDTVQYITDDTDRRKIVEIDTLSNMYHTDSYSIMFEVEDDWKLVSNKFDINTLKHFERVLVRNCNTDEWDIDFFGYYNRGLYHTTGKGLFKQCIPYENNEHMVGASVDCTDFYKNWED